MTPPDWKSAVEIFPTGWQCPAEPFWVAGWVTSASGLVPVDIRARLGEEIFLGLCGLPRPDKETEARGRAGPPHAGFSFLLEPVSGATGLRIEVCDHFGRWTELFRQSIQIASAKPLPPRPARSDVDVALDLLRAHHVRPEESWPALADEVLTLARARTFDVMPSEPFKGALEQLEDNAAIHYDHLLVTGWVAHRTQRVRRLTAFLDTAQPLPLVHGLSRPDARTHFPDFVDAEHSRFAGFLKLPLRAPRPLALRIFAELEDGREELVFLKRFRPVLTSGQGTDLPPYSWWQFRGASKALLCLGWNAAALETARDAFRAAAPVSSLPREAGVPGVPASDRPLRVVLVSHNLDREGAPLFLAEFAGHLAAQPGWDIRVVSPKSGPLALTLEAAGAHVTILDTTALERATTDSSYTEAIGQLAAAPVWADADLLIANTLVSYWAIHLAQRLRKPSLFYVHESVGARRFFAHTMSPAAIARVEAAFPLATRVAFLARASQRDHASAAEGRNFITMPGWIDVARVRSYLATADRAAVRRRLGIADDVTVFANIGGVLPRKGQHVHLEAISRLHEKSPADSARCLHLFVGAKDGPNPYVDVLRAIVESRKLSNVRLIEASAEPYAYFAAADICVCSSLEEALPRVVMEAAAFGKPIVSTDVNGIPELLPAHSAWLVPPGDPVRLANALQDALAEHQRGDRTRAERAKQHVTMQFDLAVLLPRHIQLVRALAAQPHA